MKHKDSYSYISTHVNNGGSRHDWLEKELESWVRLEEDHYHSGNGGNAVAKQKKILAKELQRRIDKGDKRASVLAKKHDIYASEMTETQYEKMLERQEQEDKHQVRLADDKYYQMTEAEYEAMLDRQEKEKEHQDKLATDPDYQLTDAGHEKILDRQDQEAKHQRQLVMDPSYKMTDTEYEAMLDRQEKEEAHQNKLANNPYANMSDTEYYKMLDREEKAAAGYLRNNSN